MQLEEILRWNLASWTLPVVRNLRRIPDLFSHLPKLIMTHYFYAAQFFLLLESEG